MKIKEKAQNLRSNIKSSILSAFLSRTFVWIYAVIALLIVIILSIVIASRNASASVSSVAFGNATEGQQCLLVTDTAKINNQKVCSQGLTCFIPLATQTQTEGTCITLPKNVSAGAYCTNSSSGPLCEKGTSCQYVKVADSSTSFAKCIQV